MQRLNCDEKSDNTFDGVFVHLFGFNSAVPIVYADIILYATLNRGCAIKAKRTGNYPIKSIITLLNPRKER